MLSKPLIIVATDLTENSVQALRAAEKLRRLTDGRIIAVHVLQYPEEWNWLGSEVVLEDFPRSYQSDLVSTMRARLALQLREHGVIADQEILTGVTVSELVKFLDTMSPDLFILGHRQRGGLLRLSGVAERIIPKIEVPVMVVSQAFETEKIAGLLDPSRPEKLIFSVTEELAFLLSSEVEFVSVYPGTKYVAEENFAGETKVVRLTPERRKELPEKMKKLMEMNSDPHLNAKFLSCMATGDSLPEVVGLLREEGIQLAVIGRHQRDTIEKIFMKSFSRRMVDQWRGNLVILPPAS